MILSLFIKIVPVYPVHLLGKIFPIFPGNPPVGIAAEMGPCGAGALRHYVYIAKTRQGSDKEQNDNDKRCGKKPVKKYAGKSTDEYGYYHTDAELQDE